MEKLLQHQRIIKGVRNTNIIMVDPGACKDHPTQIYFERVKGNLFQCAHIEHHEQSVAISTTNKPVQLYDR